MGAVCELTEEDLTPGARANLTSLPMPPGALAPAFVALRSQAPHDGQTAI